MLRQNFKWTTTLSLAAAVTLGTWVMGSHLQQAQTETRQARTGQTMLMLEFQRLHERGEVLVLDVRDRASYDAGRISGAVFATVEDLATDPHRIAEIKTLAKGRVVVTYCSCPTEASSLRAARLLDAHGVPASALVGGYPGWVEAGGRTEPDYTFRHESSR
ncbi:MAG: rhodanese-like domain-containing protein [Acidobacteria bacterium]|nr:rhodanese-like domain-containing protein [Acidobacteriota bacterium]